MLGRTPMVGCLLVLAASPCLAAEPAAKPNAVLRLRSLQALMDDVRYVARLERGDDAVRRIDEELEKTVGKDHAGFDIKKPAGIYAGLNERNVDTIVLLLPIANRDLFLTFYQKWFGKPEERDGLYTAPGGWFTPRFFRFANDYVHLTWSKPEVVSPENLLDPAKVLASTRDATVSLTFDIQGFALEFRRNVLEQMNRFAAGLTENLPGETELHQKLRKQVVANISRWLAMLAEDGDRIEMLTGVDRAAAELYFEAHLSGKPNSRLAESIALLGQAKSRFAGLPDRAAMKLLLHWTLSDDLTAAIRPVVDEAIRRAMQNAAAETIRTQSIQVAKALEPTLNPGELDVGVHLVGPGKDKSCSLLLGLKLREGDKIDAAVRDLVKSLPERDRARFKFDVARAAGVSIHRADIQELFDEGLLKLVGDQPIHFSIGPDAALVALGPDGQSLIKAAVAAQPQLAPQVDYELALLPLLPLLADADVQKKLEPLAGELFKEAGSDRVRFTVGGGKTLHARLGVKAPVIKLFKQLDNRQGRFWWLFW